MTQVFPSNPTVITSDSSIEAGTNWRSTYNQGLMPRTVTLIPGANVKPGTVTIVNPHDGLVLLTVDVPADLSEPMVIPHGMYKSLWLDFCVQGLNNTGCTLSIAYA